MVRAAAAWHIHSTRLALALLLLLFSPFCTARPLPVAYQCADNPLFGAEPVVASSWQHLPTGSMLLPVQSTPCWYRLTELPREGESLTVRNGWASMALYDSQGRELARANRIGDLQNALTSVNHVIMQPSSSWTTPLYLRVDTQMNGLPVPRRVGVEAQDINSVLQTDRTQVNISLAVSVAVFVVAFFAAVYGIMLRDRAYAWMATYLLMSVVIRVFNSSEPLIFALTQNFDQARLVSRLMYPIINAVWMLAYARMADFSIHAPRINVLSKITAALFILQIPLWMIEGPIGQRVNVCLILLLTYPLLFSGCWISWRKGSVAAGILLLSNLMLMVFWGPGQINFILPTETLTTFIESSSQFGSLTSMLGVASDLLMPLLLAVAMAMRTKGLKQAANRLISHDALTDLPNREYIRRQGAAILARHPNLAVLVLNIERFRAINAALGPEIGDQLLVITGLRLNNIEGGTVGRLHADQFCLIWPDMDSLPALRERIETSFSRPLNVDGQMVDLNLAIGVACASAVPATMAQLLRRAETALDTCRLLHLEWVEYRAELEQDMRADLGLLSELTRAVEEGELRMYLQPKVRLSDGSVSSAEALVRWQHPVRGMVPPVEFIPFAEQTGRIHLITQWMLGEAMRLCTRLRMEGTPLQISVNISTADLAKSSFVEGVVALCEQIGAMPSDIRLEVTESGAMNDPGTSLMIMHALKDAGFSLSIDDFGTGYSSLSYLQKMPVAELKIDQSFVRDVAPHTEAAVLLGSTIELGHRLGLSVVAEGAETKGECELLTSLGCDYVQGYFFSKPLPVNEFIRWRTEKAPVRFSAVATSIS